MGLVSSVFLSTLPTHSFGPLPFPCTTLSPPLTFFHGCFLCAPTRRIHRTPLQFIYISLTSPLRARLRGRSLLSLFPSFPSIYNPSLFLSVPFLFFVLPSPPRRTYILDPTVYHE